MRWFAMYVSLTWFWRKIICIPFFDAGIAEKVDYLSNLGIKAVWLSPIFRSPMVDFGYDISDFRAIEPMFGTMEDFEVLKELFQKNGMYFKSNNRSLTS